MPLKVSVIIVNYNSERWLGKCIEAIKNSNYKNIEIVIVDNNSIDKSIENIENKYKNIIIHKSKINLGYSGGNNLGVRLCSGDILLILNPDTIVKQDTISKLIAHFMKLNNYKSIIAPSLLNFDGSPQISYWRYIKVTDLLKECLFLNYIFQPKYRLCNESICPCEGLSGAALMISKQRYYELNGFDENLFWVEDIDLCYRNNLLGGQNYIARDTHAYHYIGGSSEENKDRVIANQILSRLKFFEKHYSKVITCLVFILLVLQSLIRILSYSLFAVNKKVRTKIKGYYLSVQYLIKWLIYNERKMVI